MGLFKKVYFKKDKKGRIVDKIFVFDDWVLKLMKRIKEKKRCIEWK